MSKSTRSKKAELARIYGSSCMFEKANIAERIEAMRWNKNIQKIFGRKEIQRKKIKF